MDPGTLAFLSAINRLEEEIDTQHLCLCLQRSSLCFMSSRKSFSYFSLFTCVSLSSPKSRYTLSHRGTHAKVQTIPHLAPRVTQESKQLRSVLAPLKFTVRSSLLKCYTFIISCRLESALYLNTKPPLLLSTGGTSQSLKHSQLTRTSTQPREQQQQQTSSTLLQQQLWRMYAFCLVIIWSSVFMERTASEAT